VDKKTQPDKREALAHLDELIGRAETAERYLSKALSALGTVEHNASAGRRSSNRVSRLPMASTEKGFDLMLSGAKKSIRELEDWQVRAGSLALHLRRLKKEVQQKWE